ncbi:MAG: bifunctional 2-C-methyl-D-erythritol 4-phosphate cytidylyltransferase/2-C-methyl-D-erythritol 2,4-cyclodiphosphate synthase [Rhodospirillaceae bacterium]
MTTCAIIVSAGRGHRFGAGLPKQYRMLAGAPVARHTLMVFADHPAIDHIFAVIHPDDAGLFAEAAKGIDGVIVTHGGKERQDSVRNGLARARDIAPGKVLIHDAARPFISAAMIDAVLTALEDAPGALPALPVTDTLKRGADGRIQETVDRSGLYRVQTPQGFRFAEILAAHEAAAGRALTDDAAVAEAAGMRVVMVPGDENNFKITTQEDLMRAESMMTGRAGGDIRTGMGFDVHRFEPGNGVILCGVRIPFDRRLAGHSDADVALHAITDAVLGAVGAGDIGLHFPPSDPQWRGAASAIFLEKAVEFVIGKGGELVNIDLTVICEAPKVGPHRDAMTAKVAAITGLAADRINIKATTTEQLGFTGRGEGIAAQSVATVRI